MSEVFLPFALPDIGEEEITEVVDSLRSGWITTGPKTKQFELEFAAYLGDGIHPIAVNSATAGLHLALEAIGVEGGDEVITTTHTFTATAEVVRYLGADPVFVDIDPDTFCIDPEALVAAITPKTKAIVPVHYGGLACEMTRILSVAREHGIHVIEDAAHALPTSYRGKMVGTLDSDATVFSFYATKTLSTGEGGMIVTRNSKIADRCRVMRLHGINRDAFDRYTSSKPSWHYDVVAPGFKYNMSDIAASIGIQQLKKVDRFRQKREQIAKKYYEEFSELPLILPPSAPTGDLHAWHLFVVQLDASAKIGRNEFIERMYQHGIGCSVHYIPLHQHSYWRSRYSLRCESFPNTTRVSERAVSLPIYTKMSDKDQDRISRCVREILS
jgi:dTDP-4-amino-4,6-dideoxygalactose transaminase